MRANVWAHKRIEELAGEHFPGQEAPLLQRLIGLSALHEARWKREAAGIYRPTLGMYALALQWELESHGPSCAVCREIVRVVEAVPADPGGGDRLALGPRVPLAEGGLNVPQNLHLGHEACLAPW
ncbi:MAG TPA: hypothetical protein VGV89_05230 [Thermoplasmata archaeon]|nr:hypothetical protein [Thermoplasmata archaeon]